MESSLNETKSSCTTSVCNHEVGKKQKPVGRYLSAFCSGIRDIIKHYRQEISYLEHDLMTNPYMTVTEIRAKVEPFRTVFQALDSMILKVQAQSRSSVLIVEFVKAEYDLNVHLQGILKRYVRVNFYKHLT